MEIWVPQVLDDDKIGLISTRPRFFYVWVWLMPCNDIQDSLVLLPLILILMLTFAAELKLLLAGNQFIACIFISNVQYLRLPNKIRHLYSGNMGAPRS